MFNKFVTLCGYVGMRLLAVSGFSPNLSPDLPKLMRSYHNQRTWKDYLPKPGLGVVEEALLFFKKIYRQRERALF